MTQHKRDDAPKWTDEHLPLSARRKLLAEELRALGLRPKSERPSAEEGAPPPSKPGKGEDRDR